MRFPYATVVNAAETDTSNVAASEVIKTNDLTEEDRVKRKLLKQQQSRGSSGTSQNEGSYLESLQKEKLKQDQQKKTKAQRARDLCETLGRGC